MLVVRLTAGEMADYAAVRDEIRADAEAEARERGQRTVRIMSPEGKIVDEFKLDVVLRGRLLRAGGLAPGVLAELARQLPDGERVWQEIQASWKAMRRPLGRRAIGSMYAYKGVYYRIVRGAPVRVVRIR